MTPASQQALFDDGSETSASALVVVAVPAGPLSAPQRTFNRLTERIRRGRELLAAWDTFMPRFQSRVASELGPIEQEIRDAQRRLVHQLHALIVGAKAERVSRKHLSRIRSMLLEIINNLLEFGPDSELEALYNRYSDVTHAEQCRQDLEITEAMFSEMFGPETVQGHDARSTEEFLRYAGKKIAEAQGETDDTSAGRARRGRGNRAAELKAEAARERKAQAAREASLSVREIYRKLASALHPDREADETERERKTGLLQRANQAYERNYLLELLSLQIETEQIDASTLASVPEARLAHYNQVLLDQAQQVDAQVQERAALFRVEFDLSARDVTPQRVNKALSTRISRARSTLEQIERDLQRLSDPSQRRSALDALPEPEADAADLEDLALLAAVFDEMIPPARPVARQRKRRGR